MVTSSSVFKCVVRRTQPFAKFTDFLRLTKQRFEYFQIFTFSSRDWNQVKSNSLNSSFVLYCDRLPLVNHPLGNQPPNLSKSDRNWITDFSLSRPEYFSSLKSSRTSSKSLVLSACWAWSYLCSRNRIHRTPMIEGIVFRSYQINSKEFASKKPQYSPKVSTICSKNLF